MWSPDGNQIAFRRQTNSGDRLIYLMNADGSGVSLSAGKCRAWI